MSLSFVIDSILCRMYLVYMILVECICKCMGLYFVVILKFSLNVNGWNCYCQTVVIACWLYKLWMNVGFHSWHFDFGWFKKCVSRIQQIHRILLNCASVLLNERESKIFDCFSFWEFAKNMFDSIFTLTGIYTVV